MRRKKANGSYFNDFFLIPLEADLQHAQKQHGGTHTPGYQVADGRARMVHGLRLEREILKGIDNK